MKTLEEIGIHDLKELLIKNWMTHDAMWFAHCVRTIGIETTNEVNRAAIKSLAEIEIRRVREIHGIGTGQVTTFGQLTDVIDAAFTVSIADFIKMRYEYPAENVISWKWQQQACFAYKGIRRFGLIDRYRCGVMYRVFCWLEHLGVSYTVSAPIDPCLMHTRGECSGEIRVSFPQALS